MFSLTHDEMIGFASGIAVAIIGMIVAFVLSRCGVI